MRPLEGVKVLELSEYAFVPASCAVLGEWGAEVIKVERPGGDPFRVPFRQAVEGFNTSWEQFNRNKRIVALDIREPRGREVLDRLVRWADVFVTSYRPQARRKLGIEPDDLFAINPKLVYARGSGQGARGPDAEQGGFDAVSYWARAGFANRLTPDGASPVSQPGAYGDAPSGLTLAGGISAALVGAQRTGRGVVVDVSLFATGLWQLCSDLCFAALSGSDPAKRAAGARTSALSGEYVTKDGRILNFVMLDVQKYWPLTCHALGRADLADHPDYATPEQKRARAPEVAEIFSQIVAGETLEYWEARLREHGCIFSKLATATEVLNDPQIEPNGYLIAHPEQQGAVMVPSPVQFDGEANALRSRAPTQIGQHTDEVLRELGVAQGELDALRGEGVIV